MAFRSRSLNRLRSGGIRGNVLPPSTTPQKLVASAYHIASSSRCLQSKGQESSLRYSNVLETRPSLAFSPCQFIKQRRQQHSQPAEQTAEIDHAPLIASYPEWIRPQDTLPHRHIGPSDEEIAVMLKQLDQPDLDSFIRQTIPDSIRASKEFSIPSEQTPETEMLDELTKAGKANSAAEVDTYIGMGYHPTITPGVIKRNVLENPGWYTSYTPYQPEISQGIHCTTRLMKVVWRVY